MSTPVHRLHFSKKDLQHSALKILDSKPDAIITWRLLRDVLELPSDYPEVIQAKDEAMQCKWICQLEQAQLPDGSWGRFHSQDTRQKTIFRTSEEAIDRAFALGLQACHPVLNRIKRYIQLALQEQVHITDREEKNQAWPLLIRSILAGRLAQIEPTDPLVKPFWQNLASVARAAFKSGNYRLEDEVEAYRQQTGVHIPKGFLESQHALWILSSQELPTHLEQAMLRWIMNKPDGIRYIRAPLGTPAPRRFGYWVRSMNLLARFPSWRELSTPTLNHMWDSRDKYGLWDFGQQVGGSVEFPLSGHWRQEIRRKIDYTTHMLIVLSKSLD